MPEKYRREIEEILQKLEEAPVPQRHRMRRRLSSLVRPLEWLFRKKYWRPSPGRVMLVSLVLLVTALAFQAAGVFARAVMPMIWVAVALFVVSYALMFIRPPGKYEKRWRGSRVEDQSPAWKERLRRWLKTR